MLYQTYRKEQVPAHSTLPWNPWVTSVNSYAIFEPGRYWVKPNEAAFCAEEREQGCEMGPSWLASISHKSLTAECTAWCKKTPVITAKFVLLGSLAFTASHRWDVCLLFLWVNWNIVFLFTGSRYRYLLNWSWPLTADWNKGEENNLSFVLLRTTAHRLLLTCLLIQRPVYSCKDGVSLAYVLFVSWAV